MKYFGKYNQLGEYESLYTTDIWKEEDIPLQSCIELTKEQWEEVISSRCKVVNGEHTQNPITPEEELDEKYVILRSDRNGLLSKCDWTQFSDSPLSNAQKAAWATYRQELRDLPNNVDINNVVFPIPPA